MSIKYVVNEVPDRGIAVLKVIGDLDFMSRACFKEALGQLGECEQSKLVIDISRISSLSSLYIGSLIDFGSTIQEKVRSLSVIMPASFVRACEGVGLDTVATIIKGKK